MPHVNPSSQNDLIHYWPELPINFQKFSHDRCLATCSAKQNIHSEQMERLECCVKWAHSNCSGDFQKDVGLPKLPRIPFPLIGVRCGSAAPAYDYELKWGESQTPTTQ